VGIHSPVDHVNIVYMLFYDVIAGEPGEVEPVAHLPFQIAPLWLSVLFPKAALIPVAARRNYVSNSAVVDNFHRFDIAGLVTALCAGSNSQPFGQCFFVGSQDTANTGPINRHRFFSKNVLAGGDCGIEMRGTK